MYVEKTSMLAQGEDEFEQGLSEAKAEAEAKNWCCRVRFPQPQP